MVVKGARRCVLKALDQDDGDSDDIGLMVWLEEGSRINAVRCSVCGGVLGMAC